MMNAKNFIKCAAIAILGLPGFAFAEDWTFPALKECRFMTFIDYSTSPLTIKYPDDSGYPDYPEETGTFPSVESGYSTVQLPATYTNQILSVHCPFKKEVVADAIQTLNVRYTRGNKDGVPGNPSVKSECGIYVSNMYGAYISYISYNMTGMRGFRSFNMPSVSIPADAIATLSCTLLPGDKFHGFRLIQKN
jgi:hypothetical protein